MGGVDASFVVLAGGGIAMLLIRWVMLLVLDINAESASDVIGKLLARGERERALRLCEAAPRAVYLAAAKAVLQASTRLRPGDKEWAIRDSLDRVWDEAVSAQQPRLRRLGWLAPLGLVSTLVAVLLAHAHGWPPVPVYLAGSSAGYLWFACRTRRKGIERKLRQGRQTLLPKVLAYVVAANGGAGTPPEPVEAAAEVGSPPAESAATSEKPGVWSRAFLPALLIVSCVGVGGALSGSYPAGTVTGEIRSTGQPHGDFWFRPADCFHGAGLGFEGVWVVSTLEGKYVGRPGFKGGLKLVRGAEGGWDAVLERPLGCRGFRCPQLPVEQRECTRFDLHAEVAGWFGRQDGHARLDCAFAQGGRLTVDVSFRGCAELPRFSGDVD